MQRIDMDTMNRVKKELHLRCCFLLAPFDDDDFSLSDSLCMCMSVFNALFCGYILRCIYCPLTLLRYLVSNCHRRCQRKLEGRRDSCFLLVLSVFVRLSCPMHPLNCDYISLPHCARVAIRFYTTTTT